MLNAIRVDTNTDTRELADWFEAFAHALRNGAALPTISRSAGEVTKFGRLWTVDVHHEFIDATPDDPAQKRAYQKAMNAANSARAAALS